MSAKSPPRRKKGFVKVNSARAYSGNEVDLELQAADLELQTADSLEESSTVRLRAASVSLPEVVVLPAVQEQRARRWNAIVECAGAIAGCATTAAFIPQVVEIAATGDTSGLSLPMYCIFVFGVLMWIVYGVCKKAGAMIGANVVTFVLAGYILSQIIDHEFFHPIVVPDDELAELSLPRSLATPLPPPSSLSPPLPLLSPQTSTPPSPSVPSPSPSPTVRSLEQRLPSLTAPAASAANDDVRRRLWPVLQRARRSALWRKLAKL
jgi:MtN3 and saliva related transmembrane protein